MIAGIALLSLPGRKKHLEKVIKEWAFSASGIAERLRLTRLRIQQSLPTEMWLQLSPV